MPKPNMDLSSFKEWQESKAFKDYKDHHDDMVDAGDIQESLEVVLNRTERVIKNNGTKEEEEQVSNFISRMKGNDAGEAVFGEGSKAISAKTASLRNWGYDPSGLYS